MERKRDRSERWWVVQHHDEFKTEAAQEMPSTKVEKGERGKKVYGPFTSEEKAKERANALRGKTLKSLVGK